MPDRELDALPPHDRRDFFRTGLGRLLRPLAELLESRISVVLPVLPSGLRPPGARPEKEFLDTCFRCGACADACPAKAIQLDQSGDEQRVGTPFVDPDIQACVVCDDLACMKACPSGALRLVDRLEIRMGLARVEQSLCARSTGEDCTECITRCPIGSVAIRLDEDGRVEVIDPRAAGHGCTGCGVCQQYCPTLPKKAIRVHPM